MQTVRDAAINAQALKVSHKVQALKKRLNEMYVNLGSIEETSGDSDDDSDILMPDDSMPSTRSRSSAWRKKEDSPLRQGIARSQR